jgi:hypothetical protein
MGRKTLELSGQVFGRLTVIEIVKTSNNKNSRWLVRCSCGVEKEATGSKLKNGRTKSCGCLRRNIKTKAKTKAKTKEKTVVRDLTGQTFSRLTVLSRAENIDNSTAWNCTCECGVEKVIRGNSLKTGSSKSCGCNRVTHGLTRTTEYSIWLGIKSRCANPKDKDYENYGGRGISVAKEWEDSFEQFYKDMGSRPSNKHSIDRRDNDLGYSKNNCRWADQKTQARNRRNTILITYKGKTKCISAWEEELGFSRSILHNRLNHLGWSIDKSFNTPVRKKAS